MSELSLQCAPKRTSAIYGFTPQLRDETPRRQSSDCSIAARGGDGLQALVAEHMRHEAQGLENLRKRGVANA